MARPKGSVIVQSLRQVVRNAVANDEEISVRQARARVEKDLGLEEGFLVSTDEWKRKSKSVLQAAIAEESEGEEPAPLPTPKSNTAKHQSLHTASESTAKPAKTAAKVTKPQPIAGKGAKSKLSDQRVAGDSSEEASSRSEADVSKISTSKTPEQPKQVNGIKRKADESSTSDEDSESESGSSSEADSVGSPHKKKARTDASSSSGEGSEESSEAESVEDDDEGQDKPESPPSVAATAKQAVPAISPKAFNPPSGFTLVESDLPAAPSSLAPTNLNGKQVWQITAPSHLSLSSIKEISLGSLRSGQPVLTQNGIEYVLSENTDAAGEACTVLLPAGNTYQPIDHRVELALHLQQKIALPNLTIRQADQNTGSSAAAEIRASHITSSRQQPKGLRMRYKPPGSGPGRPGIAGSASDSDEDEQGISNVRVTTSVTKDVDKVSVDNNANKQNSKESKKKRKSKDSGESATPTINGVQRHDLGSSKLSKPKQPSLTNGVLEESLTAEERKRIKRERKEAKQKAK